MSIEIEQIEDYNERNISLLLTQYKNSENFNKLLSIFNAQMDKLESASFEVRDLFWLDTAVGVQLDIIGDILNATREGRNDTEYRAYIKQVAALNISGTPEQVINVLLTVYGLTGPILYNEEFPAGYFIYDELGYGLVHSVLEQYSPAGVLGFFGSPIAQGDITDTDPWLIDALGEEICCAQQVETITFITEDNDSIITESGDNLGGDALL